MVTTLYIVRHCQSMGNVEGRFQGRFDAEISPLGEKQLDLLSLRFRNEALDAVYSSPLKRAVRTAEAVNRFHNLPIHIMEDLMEIDVGELEDMPLAELAEKRPDIVHHWDETPDLLEFPGGETMPEVYRRVCQAVGGILRENPGKAIALVSHGGFIHCVDAWVRFDSIAGMRNGFLVENTSVSTLLCEDGKLSWKRVNDTSHLPEECS